jgi:hypothetical protein
LFTQCVAQELHLEDPQFGAVLLAVLALASRVSPLGRLSLHSNTNPALVHG